jgi:hypothetical protein
MTTADKTKEKLLDSMRRSKSDTARKQSAGTSATATKKTSARRAPAKAAAQKQHAPEAAVMMAVTQQTSNDPYQSSGRIWPD